MYERDFEKGRTFKSNLVHCPNVKRMLIVENEEEKITTVRTFQKYPKMEYLCWMSHEMKGFSNLLNLNPNIHTFETISLGLWKNRNLMMTEKVHFNILAILIEFHQNYDLFFRLLNRLHRRGVYKQLKLCFYKTPTQEMLDVLASQNIALIEVQFPQTEGLFDVSALKNLEEIHVKHSNQIADIEALADNLTKLERIAFKTASFNEMLPLISRTANPKEIRIVYFETGIHYNAITRIINMLALKKIREKLLGVRKITMYVNEVLGNKMGI